MAKVALLIGTETYAEGLSSLPSAPKDVEAIASILNDPKLGGFDVEQLINKDHTTIATRIETWFQERQKDDLALLYISGHGVKDDRSNLYFAAKDTHKHKEKLITATAVSAFFVRDCIRESKAKRQVIILDCCFSGAIGDQLPKGYETIDLEPLLRANDSEALWGAEGRVILTSSSSIQYSFQQREGPLSIYTHYLVEGIRTGAADTNGDGTISVEELHDYVSRKVQKESPAMTPKIIVLKDEGYQIPIARAPQDDPTVIYRKQFEKFVEQDGETIKNFRRIFLKKIQDQHKLTNEEVQAVEAEVLEPIRQRKEKEQEYREFLIKVLEDTPSLGEGERSILLDFQKLLGLRDENVKPIEDEILAQCFTIQSPNSEPETRENDLDQQEEAQLIQSGPPSATEQSVDQTQQGSGSTTTNGSATPTSEQRRQSSLETILFFWETTSFFKVGVAVLVVSLVFVLWRMSNNGLTSQRNRSPSPTPSLVPVQKLISAGDNEELYGSRSSSGQFRGSVRYRQQLTNGIADFKNGNYELSSDTFESILDDTGNEPDDPRKDPELIVFRNNSEARKTGEPIYTIAAAIPLSDANGEPFDVGQQMLFGIAQAQTKAIEDGINLEVIIANDLNVPEQAEKLAEELTKSTITGSDDIQREILAIVGHYSSTVTCVALPVYNRAGLAVISPVSTKADLRSACNGEQVFFRTTSSSAVEAQALVDYLINRSRIDNPRVAIFYKRGEGFSQDLTNAFRNILGNRAQVNQFDLSNSSDFDQGKRQLDEFNVLAVFPDGRTSDATALDRAIELLTQDSGDKLILGSNPLYSAKVSGISNSPNTSQSHELRVQPTDPGKGLIVAVDWFAGCGSNPDFVREAKSVWGGDPTRVYAMSYEAVQVLIDRIKQERANQEEITKSSILNAVGDSMRMVQSYVFQNETISFTQNGDRAEIENRILITPRAANGFEPVEGACSP